MGGTIQTRDHLLRAMDVPGLQGVALDALQFVEDPDLLGSLNPAPI